MTQENERKKILLNNFLKQYIDEYICKIEVGEYKKNDILEIFIYWNINQMYDDKYVRMTTLFDSEIINEKITKDVLKILKIKIKIHPVLWDC